MIALSPGLLHSSFKLLEMISKRTHQLSVLASSLPRIEILPAVDVVNFAMGIGWVGSDHEGKAAMTALGAAVHKLLDSRDRFRQALLDYIGIVRPTWAQLTPRGRQETLSVLSPEIWQCFAEAELVVSYSGDVVAWWDALAARARGQSSEILLETGRKGERLSFRYEEWRTGEEPKWQSFESNLAGYDLLSVVGPHDRQLLQIEVKATEASVANGFFHITLNEWETSLLANCYVFHLWSLGQDIPLLATVSKEEIAQHIPANRAKGRWELVKIPFATFSDRFFAYENEHECKASVSKAE